MTTLDDLPAWAVRLITRAAQTRHIPGTNRFARICRSWRDATQDSQDSEQLQLLVALEGLHPDAITSISQWLSRHGRCATSLHITCDPTTAPLFQQLPLSTAPLVGLARLEVDGPDSLVALAPALPHLVSLTHLRASVEMVGPDNSTLGRHGVFSAQGVALEPPPSLQQLCPGLKSLHLAIVTNNLYRNRPLEAPVAQLLPDHLEQLHIACVTRSAVTMVRCATLVPYTSLRRLTLTGSVYDGFPEVMDPDLLLHMPQLEEVDLRHASLLATGMPVLVQAWLEGGLFAAPQHITKLAGVKFGQYEPGSFISAPLSAALSGLRKLDVTLENRDAAAGVQQLSALHGLKHLSLELFEEAASEVEDVLAALSCVQQLTCLHLDGHVVLPRSTWASALPHLRVLVVDSMHLEDLAPELYRVPRLQCLYLVYYAGVPWDPARTFQQVAPHLEVLSKCSSLQAVLCGGTASHGHTDVPVAQHIHVHQHYGRLHLSEWYAWRDAAVAGRVICPQTCPHLPGVLELQQQESADG